MTKNKILSLSLLLIAVTDDKHSGLRFDHTGWSNYGEAWMKIKQLIANFLKEEDGLTTVEYAVAGGVITSSTMVAFEELGKQVEIVVNGIINGIGGSASPPPK